MFSRFACKWCQSCWECWAEQMGGEQSEQMVLILINGCGDMQRMLWSRQEQLMNEWIMLFSFNFALVVRLILSYIQRENTTILATTVSPFILDALGKRIRDKRVKHITPYASAKKFRRTTGLNAYVCQCCVIIGP